MVVLKWLDITLSGACGLAALAALMARVFFDWRAEPETVQTAAFLALWLGCLARFTRYAQED